MRRTKIICTIGPASKDITTIKELIKAGMNIARLNASHGSLLELDATIKNIRKACAELKKNVSILLDLEGPHVRVGEIAGGQIGLESGEKVIISGSGKKENHKCFSINYKNIIKSVNPGNTVLLDDGRIKLRVLKRIAGDLHCRVLDGGMLKSHKSVNIPGVLLDLPALTKKDLACVRFGVQRNVDLLGLSFVRYPNDVAKLRQIIKEMRARTWIIAKVEHPLAVAHINEIIEIADGIMIARGDLGVEMPTEDIPIIQKSIITKCLGFAKPVITATQMLESMVENLIPTRAEATDVANAIFDGTDAVMLSGETAVGKHPALVVQTMARIICKAEIAQDYNRLFAEKKIRRVLAGIPQAISHASVQAMIDLQAQAIITTTQSGQTARLIACHRPSAPIYAMTPDKEIVGKLNLLWGVAPYHVNTVIRNTDTMIGRSINVLKKQGKVDSGDTVVVTSGAPMGIPGKTNMLQVQVVK